MLRTPTIRLLTLSCSVVVALSVAAAEASADTAEARRSAPVYADQGEKSDVITRVRAGTRMKVLRRDGRWVKVRANGRIGWIPRSYLQVRQARATVSKKRKVSFVDGRSRRRKARTAPKDRIGAEVVEEETLSEFEEDKPKRRRRVAARDDDLDEFEEEFSEEGLEGDDFEEEFEEEEEDLEEDIVVVEADEADLFAKPGDDAEPIDWAEKGDKLWVLERDDGWIRVENERGEMGWVRSSDVGAKEYRYSKWTKRARAGLGYASIGQTFRSSSDDPLGNYSIGSDSLVVGIGGELLYNYSKDWILAGDGTFSYVRASPGIRYVDPNDMNVASDIPFQMYNLDIGARAGYKLGGKMGMALYGRLGYYYGKLAIANTSDFTVNIPKLPSEILSGPTVGAILDVPKYDEKWSGQVGLKGMIGGSLAQTAGLEDGNLSDTSAYFADARVNYQWKPNLKLSGTYQFGYHKTKWTGAAMNSQRDHGAADARRTDQTHTLMVGVGRLF